MISDGASSGRPISRKDVTLALEQFRQGARFEDAVKFYVFGMREQEQDAISEKYGVHNGRTFATWLRSLNDLRNVSAHHSRLWNRNSVDQPKLPSIGEVSRVGPFEDDSHLRARCYLLLRIARQLLQVVNPSSSSPERVKVHLETFSDLEHLGLNLVGMGTHDGWEQDC
jgi:abortive infection bacteriophage resistance protein